MHYRDADTPFGITRKTALKLAKTLGLTETEVIHAARRLRKRLMPIGPDGIIEIDDPPDWFARTGQDALFHRERHTGKRFRL